MGDQLELEVAVEDFAHVLADHELAQALQVRQPLEEQDAFDELVRMLHLVDRLVVRVLAEPVEPPVLQHAGMQEILVDCGQFVLEDLVEMSNDFDVALHDTGSKDRLEDTARAARSSGQEA